MCGREVKWMLFSLNNAQKQQLLLYLVHIRNNDKFESLGNLTEGLKVRLLLSNQLELLYNFHKVVNTCKVLLSMSFHYPYSRCEHPVT